MEEIILALALIYLSPFLIWFFLYGCIEVKKLVKKEQSRIEIAVNKWEEMKPEQRMEAEVRAMGTTAGQTKWIPTPTPEDEIKDREERVFKEGLLKKTLDEEV